MGHPRSVPKKRDMDVTQRSGRPVGHHLHTFILIGNLKVAIMDFYMGGMAFSRLDSRRPGAVAFP